MAIILLHITFEPGRAPNTAKLGLEKVFAVFFILYVQNGL